MQDKDPLIGAWKLNIAKSNYWALQQATMKELIGIYHDLGGGQIEVVGTGTRTDGKLIVLKAVFPRQGGGIVTPEGMSYVVTVIDLYTFYLTILKDGRQVLMYHSTISKNGKRKRDYFKGIGDRGNAFEGVEIWDRQ